MIKETYAIKGYFFGKNYQDLGHSIASSFGKVIEKGFGYFKDIPDAWDLDNPFFAVGLTLFYLILGIAVLAFGTIFTTVLSLIHVVVVTLVMIFVYLGYVVAAFMDKTYRTFYKLRNNCPNPDCQRKYDLPVYHCPKCDAPHEHLYPNKYGIFHHRCTCGTKLPTLLINGRHKLLASCPHCGHKTFPGINASTIFPVFGGRDSGKTCLINSALTELEALAPTVDCEYQYFYDVVGDERRGMEAKMKQGKLPGSTHDENLVFYNFYFTPRGSLVKNLVSLCDVAGEVFQTRGNIVRQVGYRYADAVIFVLDPLSIQSFRQEMVDKGYDVTRFAPSDHQVGDILAAMLSSLDILYRKKNWKLSLAVAITKNDFPGIQEYLGQKAVERYQESHRKASTIEARDALAREFLIGHGESNALNLMDSRFRKVHFFFTSATGKNFEEGKQLRSYGNGEPVLYVIDKSYRNLNFDKEIWRN